MEVTPDFYHNSDNSDNQPSAFDTLGDEVQFIGPIPEDLKNIPERTAGICLREREVMNDPANREKRAFNIFTVNVLYMDEKVFNQKSENFKIIIDDPGFWNPERRELQEYGVKCQFNNTKALSESLRNAERELGIPPTIYMLSGISAAGKTTACKKIGFPGMIYEIKENGEKGDPIGTLATDNSKTYLWMAGGSCDQIHAESSMMMRKVDVLWAQYVDEMDGDCSEVRDKTFSDLADVNDIIQNAKETNRKINDLDIDVPFIVSAVGVMMRPKGSHEPHPGFGYLCDNYIKMKETRFVKLNNLYPSSGLDVSFSLMCYDYNSNPKERQREAARFIKDEDGATKLHIINEELYNQAVIPVTFDENHEIDTNNPDYKAAKMRFEAEAADVGNQLLTQEFIDDYCKTFINQADEDYIRVVQEKLGVYLDSEHPKTIAEILNDNANA